MALDLDALYARLADDLLVFLTRRTADPQVALDLWAETFAQAVAARRRYRGRTDEEAVGWLYGIARRQLALYYRRGVIEQKASRRLQLERPPAPPEVLDELSRRAGLAELRADLATALASLSTGVREAVALRVVDELPYPEVAARLGIAEPAARARVSRGLSTLSDLLDRPTITKAMTS